MGISGIGLFEISVDGMFSSARADWDDAEIAFA